MKVEIYIREKSSTREIRVPILPEQIRFSDGDATFIVSDIMGLGEVAIPSGTELAAYSWESEFPGKLRKNDAMSRGIWKDPRIYCNIMNEWRQKGTLLTLMILGYPVNTDVYCKGFTLKGTGAFGDVSYEVQFIEARKITIETSKVETSTTERPTAEVKTYTIKYGDTLWAIAEKFYGDGTKWGEIYKANKEIIEQTAKKYGKSSSENGHWIYPGVTLTIPDITAATPPPAASTPTTSSGSSSNKAAAATGAAKAEYNKKRNETVANNVQKLSGGGGGVNTMLIK